MSHEEVKYRRLAIVVYYSSVIRSAKSWRAEFNGVLLRAAINSL